MIEAFCEGIDRFARAHIHARRIDAAHRIDPSVLAGLGELGVFGASIPEEYGGSDLGLPDICTLVTTLAKHDRSVATTVGLHLGLGTRGLVAYGSPALKERWLPDIATGRRLAAFATTEAEAGSDLSAIRTRAVPVDPADVSGEGGGPLQVDGEKIFVTNGGIAGVYTITASTPGLGGAKRGHSLLLIDRDDNGVTPGPEEEKLGLRGSSTTTVHFDGTRIPMDRVIGVPGEGMTQLGHVLAWGRTVMAAGCVGSAGAALDAAVEHVGTRRQFGRTLDSFDVVRDQIADISAVRFVMAALVRSAASGDRLLGQSIAAKVFCSEGSWEITDTALQLFGGTGYVEETGIALILRDARVTRIFEGANDVLRVHLGMLEVAPATSRAALSDLSPLGRAADSFHDTVVGVRTDLTTRFGVRLGREQRLLHRLGQLALLRDACDAAVVQAAADATPRSTELASRWLSLSHSRSLALLPEPHRPTQMIDRTPGGIHA